ncbi:MAG: hypothetical protein ABNH21_06575 [Glaciecola sp.]|jgi:hypothetical protein
MPFKSGKSPRDLSNHIDAKLKDIAGPKLEQALTTVAYMVGGRADFYVPIDTSALLNSRQISITPEGESYRATIGYYQDYAVFLHGSETFTPTWQPKPAGSASKPTGGYNAQASAFWINKGAEEIDVPAKLRELLTDASN